MKKSPSFQESPLPVPPPLTYDERLSYPAIIVTFSLLTLLLLAIVWYRHYLKKKRIQQASQTIKKITLSTQLISEWQTALVDNLTIKSTIANNIYQTIGKFIQQKKQATNSEQLTLIEQQWQAITKWLQPYYYSAKEQNNLLLTAEQQQQLTQLLAVIAKNETN